MSNIRRQFREQIILHDILGNGLVTEEVDFNRILDKVKSYAKKGLLTAAILTSLMSNSAFSEVQKDAINNAAQTEMTSEVGGGEVVTAKELNGKIKKGGYRATVGSNVTALLKGGSDFKLYYGKSNSEHGAITMAKNKAQSDGIQAGTAQAAQSKTVVRTIGGKVEVILIVPIQ